MYIDQLGIVRIEEETCVKYGYYDANSNFVIHRENDEPAIQYNGGGESYYLHGVKYAFKLGICKIYYIIARKASSTLTGVVARRRVGFADDIQKNEQQFVVGRENDLPHIEHDDGYKAWTDGSHLHRENGKPAVIDGNGRKYYYNHGKPIRMCFTFFRNLCSYRLFKIIFFQLKNGRS
jgi:hypothetical protein